MRITTKTEYIITNEYYFDQFLNIMYILKSFVVKKIVFMDDNKQI